MMRGALEYLSKAINNLVTPEIDKLTMLAESSGFEIIGECSRGCYSGNPLGLGMNADYYPFGRIGSLTYSPLCRAVMLKRTLGSDEELLVVCNDKGIFYRGGNLEGAATTLNEKCPSCKDSTIFSQNGSLEFKAVTHEKIKEFLSAPQLIAAGGD